MIRCAPDKALQSIASGKLTFDDRSGVQRGVGLLASRLLGRTCGRKEPSVCWAQSTAAGPSAPGPTNLSPEP